MDNLEQGSKEISEKKLEWFTKEVMVTCSGYTEPMMKFSLT